MYDELKIVVDAWNELADSRRQRADDPPEWATRTQGGQRHYRVVPISGWENNIAHYEFLAARRTVGCGVVGVELHIQPDSPQLTTHAVSFLKGLSKTIKLPQLDANEWMFGARLFTIHKVSEAGHCVRPMQELIRQSRTLVIDWLRSHT
jgi:hypothetical protein